jgi:hypothetical protein
MTPTIELVIRCTVAFVVGFTIAYTSAWLLSIFLWGWLAAVLAVLATVRAAQDEDVRAVTHKAGDLAVEGAAHAINAFRSLRARLTA